MLIGTERDETRPRRPWPLWAVGVFAGLLGLVFYLAYSLNRSERVWGLTLGTMTWLTYGGVIAIIGLGYGLHRWERSTKSPSSRRP